MVCESVGKRQEPVMDDALREELQKLVEEILATRRALSDETRLYHDLWISGDDASELLTNVHKKFGTRFERFRFDTYFPNETDAIFYHIAQRLGFPSKRKSFTFGHLVKVVEAGRWFEPAEG